MDANGDLNGGAVSILRDQGVLVDDYTNPKNPNQTTVLLAIARDHATMKSLLVEAASQYEELGKQYRKLEEELDKMAENEFLRNNPAYASKQPSSNNKAGSDTDSSGGNDNITE